MLTQDELIDLDVLLCETHGFKPLIPEPGAHQSSFTYIDVNGVRVELHATEVRVFIPGETLCRWRATNSNARIRKVIERAINWSRGLAVVAKGVAAHVNAIAGEHRNLTGPTHMQRGLRERR
jgi:hypothetical protein